MKARELASPSRRDFLTATSAIGGGLLLGFGLPVRAGATARVMLVTAAAQRGNVDPSACHAQNGIVVHSATAALARNQ
jgi:anaerobic selenocysteine-containing dehydrogenase